MGGAVLRAPGPKLSRNARRPARPDLWSAHPSRHALQAPRLVRFRALPAARWPEHRPDQPRGQGPRGAERRKAPLSPTFNRFSWALNPATLPPPCAHHGVYSMPTGDACRAEAWRKGSPPPALPAVAQHPPDFIPPESTAKGRTSEQIADGIARSARARCAPFWCAWKASPPTRHRAATRARATSPHHGARPHPAPARPAAQC